MIIAGAGGAAHLPGMVAALTPLPVVGVPVVPAGAQLGGVDALLSIVQARRLKPQVHSCGVSVSWWCNGNSGADCRTSCAHPLQVVACAGMMMSGFAYLQAMRCGLRST